MAGFLRNTLAANPNDEKLKLKIEEFTVLSPIFALTWQDKFDCQLRNPELDRTLPATLLN